MSDNQGHSSSPSKMKTVMWQGNPFEVVTKEVPKAKIVNKGDAVVRITTAAICGSDLHVYHGVLGSNEVPYPLGHEGMGIVEAVGETVSTVKVGDRVIIPCLPSDGHIDINLTLLPNLTSYGVGKDFGDLGGCQAEYVRVPFADESLVIVNDVPSIPDNDLLFLSDVFCTGWGCVDLSGFQPGDDVAVFGAGPVGLLCAYSAILRGARKVYSIDHVASRLQKAASIGAIPIDFSKEGAGGAAAQVLQLAPSGVARICDCVGYECVNEKLEPEQGYIINEAVKMASSHGGIGVIGLYLAEPDSKGVPRGATLSPTINFPVSTWWLKSLTIRGGVVPPDPIIPAILALIKSGRAKPSFIVSKEYHGLDDAPEAYRRFDKHLETKVVFKFGEDDIIECPGSCC